jgi:hypothetical protein
MARSIDWKDQEGTFAFVEFQSELTVSGPNQYTGGAALVSPLLPKAGYRMVTSGRGADLRAAIYSRTDLLEPIVKIAATNSDIGSGISGLVTVNYDLDADRPADFTYDNYYASANPSTPIGMPGTPQVINLVPAPQTLFYQPPANGSNITFQRHHLHCKPDQLQLDCFGH